MNRRLLSLSIALTITASGCVTTTECDCFSLSPWALSVSGTVTQNNAPISGRIIVSTHVFEGECASDLLALDIAGSPPPPDAHGRFSIELHTLQEVTSGCVRFRVLRASSVVGMGPDTLLVVQRTGIRVRALSSGRPVDSLTVALAVP